MCDPVTLSIGAGAASAYGTTLAVGTGATGLMTAASIGLTVAGTGLQMAAQQQARKLEESKFEMQKRRYEQEAIEERIATEQKENQRKRDYFKNLKANYAMTAGRGITQDSPSASRILQSNKEILRQDLDSISLTGFEREMFNRGMAQEAGIARQASSPMGEIATAVTGVSRATSLFSEINKPKTGRNLLKETANSSSYNKLMNSY